MAEEVEKKTAKKSVKKDVDTIKNNIEVNPTLNEQSGKTVVLGWGRMNPVTIGHEKLANKIKSVAKQNNAKPLIYLTHSHDPKKNPLKYDDKVALAKKAFGRDVVQKSNAKTIIQAMQELDGKYDNVILVVGQDRVSEFEKLLLKYNGKDYTFDSIKIVSAGDRDPDAEGVEGMSASKMRAAVADGEKDAFISGLPKALKRDGEKVYDMVRSGMGINEEVEFGEERQPLTRTQRRNMAITMRRNKAKIAAGRRRAKNRKPSLEKIKVRAQKRARDIIKKKVLGKSDVSYNDLSDSQKQMIDKKVMKRKAAISRLAKKLIPKIRSEEIDINTAFVLNEDFEFTFEAKTAQDPDVKDMEGTQPKKYYSGVKKSEKDDRARHFAKGAKMDDDNPAAYKPAPGDEGAETKPSKYTKKYKEMYGEACERDTQPRKRFHQLMNKNGTPKFDMRFKAFRVKKVEELRDMHNEEFENDEQVIKLIDEIYESVTLEESKTDTALQKKADKSGISKSILKDVYDRGVAAWRTGHRPGTTPAQWGMARVNSFITGGKTRTTADADLWKKHSGKNEEVELEEGPIKAIGTAFKKYRLDKEIRKTRADREQMIRQSKTNNYQDYAKEYEKSLAKSDDLKKQLKRLSKKEEVELDEAVMQGSKEHLKKLQGMLDKVKPGSVDHSQIRGAIESKFGKQHIPAKHRNVKPDMYEEVDLDSFFDLNESFNLAEASILDKALAAIHKHVTGGTDLMDIAYQVSRARGVDMSSRELQKAYIKKYGEPDTGRKSNPDVVARLKKKYDYKEEGGAGDRGTDKLVKRYKKDTPGEELNEQCDLIGTDQIKAFEKFVDRMFKTYGIDFNFTRHFADRMSDDRNTPCIKMKELADFIKKIYANQGKSLKSMKGAEAVIKDMQTDLNIPVAVEYDARNDEFDVVMKTIMRKKNFRTPNKVIKY